MSDLTEALKDLIEAAIKNGRLKERLKIMEIMKQVSVEDEFGEHAYIRDVWDYLKMADLEEQEKRTKE